MKAVSFWSLSKIAILSLLDQVMGMQRQGKFADRASRSIAGEQSGGEVPAHMEVTDAAGFHSFDSEEAVGVGAAGRLRTSPAARAADES